MRFKFPAQGWPHQDHTGITRASRKTKPASAPARAKQDLEQFLGSIDKSKILSLGNLNAGDSLKVTTRNTTYTFQMLGPREAVLSTNRIDRPAGPARLRGCTFGRSSSIAPDHIFCGGNLEFLFNSTKKIHRTTEITAILWLSRRAN